MRLSTFILIVLALGCVMVSMENARLRRQLDVAHEQISRLTITRPAMKCQAYSEMVRADTAIEESCIVTRWRV